MASKQNLVAELIQLNVRDWQTMATFYQEVLGFEPIFLEPNDRYGWLQSGAIKLALRGGATLWKDENHAFRCCSEWRK